MHNPNLLEQTDSANRGWLRRLVRWLACRCCPELRAAKEIGAKLKDSREEMDGAMDAETFYSDVKKHESA